MKIVVSEEKCAKPVGIVLKDAEIGRVYENENGHLWVKINGESTSSPLTPPNYLYFSKYASDVICGYQEIYAGNIKVYPTNKSIQITFECSK